MNSIINNTIKEYQDKYKKAKKYRNALIILMVVILLFFCLVTFIAFDAEGYAMFVLNSLLVSPLFIPIFIMTIYINKKYKKKITNLENRNYIYTKDIIRHKFINNNKYYFMTLINGLIEVSDTEYYKVLLKYQPIEVLKIEKRFKILVNE